MHPALRVVGLNKVFTRRSGERVTALDNVSLSLARGEMLVLLGPSGCGKTTLLRSIAGLETPDQGQIEIAGRSVFNAEQRKELSPEKRGIAMVFQSYALWPHMTVANNIRYALRSQIRWGQRAEIAERVQEIMRKVGIADLEKQYPTTLSGGQQQRVALARSLVAKPSVILFDEPLSAIDARVRQTLRRELVEMQRALGFTGVFVTHDQAEAMQLADHLAVMRDGQIAQMGPPETIYGLPSSPEIGHFIGHSNQVGGTCRHVPNSPGNPLMVETPLGTVAGAPHPAMEFSEGDRVVAFFRPEHVVLTVSPQDSPDYRNAWPAVLEAMLFSGSHTEFTLSIDGSRFLGSSSGRSTADLREGGHVHMSVEWRKVLIFRQA